MDLLIFSDNSQAHDYFCSFRRNKFFTAPAYYSLNELKKRVNLAEIKNIPTLIYLDQSGLSEEETGVLFRFLDRKRGIYWGLIDPQNQTRDIGALFRQGGVDYAGSSVIQDGISLKRLKGIQKYLQEYRKVIIDSPADKEQAAIQNGLIPVKQGWREIVPGKEYTFFLMYIELDGRSEMEKKYGSSNLAVALNSFRGYVESALKPYGGRLWIWSRFGGIVLFPFSPDSNDFIYSAFRMRLFKELYDVEGSLFPNFISMRIVLHAGNLVYVKKNTGQVISDTLNSLFHLGQKYAEKGNFYVTEEVFQYLPLRIKDYFVPAADFDGRRIIRMKVPRY
ncbi:MAG TPA: hypothetical protein ENI06_07480 [Spirochaetales bacterium]|nr:hypothetical protein [Spirochaetales bacterium]